jgi:hypothetical protein
MNATIDNPADLIASLDPEQLTRRLAELAREQSALRVLLRAARARQRQERHAHTPQADPPAKVSADQSSSRKISRFSND